MSCVFEYRALVNNQMTEGHLEANTEQEALRLLSEQGKQTISIIETKASQNGSALFQSQKIKFDEIERFLRQLANLLSSGVSLSQALGVLSSEASTELAKEKWEELHSKVSDGSSLADAMSQYPDVFPHVTVAMVRAGEAGGFLDQVLEQIADFKEREKEIRSKVVTASIYPMLLATLSVGVLVFLMVFFIPRFQKIFEGFGSELPALTLVIVNTSEAMRDYGLWFVMAALLIGVLVNRWIKTSEGREHFETCLIKLPVLGRIITKLALSRFSRTLGTLLQAGVSLLESLSIAKQALGFQSMSEAMQISIDRVKQGESLAKSLKHDHVMQSKLFDRSFLEIVAVAEESSRLDHELLRLAERHEKELDRQIKAAVSLVEPLMLILIAAIIGVIFIGMVVPIFSIQDYIQ